MLDKATFVILFGSALHKAGPDSRCGASTLVGDLCRPLSLVSGTAYSSSASGAAVVRANGRSVLRLFCILCRIHSQSNVRNRVRFLYFALRLRCDSGNREFKILDSLGRRLRIWNSAEGADGVAYIPHLDVRTVPKRLITRTKSAVEGQVVPRFSRFEPAANSSLAPGSNTEVRCHLPPGRALSMDLSTYDWSRVSRRKRFGL